MSPIMPRPEFGRPATGLVRMWFRNDAHMRRNAMTPEQREAEARRISARRRQAREMRDGLTRKQWQEREQKRYEEMERRRAHVHWLCGSCEGGMEDVGAIDGSLPDSKHERGGERAICCVCLAVAQTEVTDKVETAKWGPNSAIFRCRVLNPDDEQIEVTASLPDGRGSGDQ